MTSSARSLLTINLFQRKSMGYPARLSRCVILPVCSSVGASGAKSTRRPSQFGARARLAATFCESGKWSARRSSRSLPGATVFGDAFQ
eukprot:10536833-Lingulodinium_polyedra.AAC.1